MGRPRLPQHQDRDADEQDNTDHPFSWADHHQDPGERPPPYYLQTHNSGMSYLRSGGNLSALFPNPPRNPFEAEANQQISNLSENQPSSPSTISCGELSSHQTDEFSLAEDEDEDESDEIMSCNFPERAVAAESEISCEFAGKCKMAREGHNHYRKIISHVFGRNKSATKVFPTYVWVHYCRKHYQRARYRANQWPFTQCDLLLESLRRMEVWGGVDSFQLLLRRREQDRRLNANTDAGPFGPTTVAPRSSSGPGSAARSTPIGRRNPTAVTAPVPDWLLERIGSGLTFDDVREVIRQIRRHMEDRQDDEEEEGEEGGDHFAENTRSNQASKTKKGKARRVSSTLSSKRTRSPIRFPDIEIIPTFKGWAREEHNTSRKQKKIDKGKNNSSQKSKNKPSTSGRKCPSEASTIDSSSASQEQEFAAANFTPSSRRVFDRVNERGGVKKPKPTTHDSNTSARETRQRPPNGKDKGKDMKKGPPRKR